MRTRPRLRLSAQAAHVAGRIQSAWSAIREVSCHSTTNSTIGRLCPARFQMEDTEVAHRSPPSNRRITASALWRRFLATW